MQLVLNSIYRGQLIIYKKDNLMKNYKYIALFLLSLSIASCEDSSDFDPIEEQAIPQVGLSTGNLNVSNYVALGASFTAGFTDNGLFKAAQENSFPNILASKFKLTNGGDFNQPLMNDNIGGLLFGGELSPTGGFRPRLFFNGSGPAVLEGTPTTEATEVLSGPFNNLGVPGAKSFHLLAAGYGNLAGLPLGLANPYFVRMASNANTTMIADAMVQQPTFFTLSEIGGNDVLSFATSGGVGVDQSPSENNPTGNLDPATYGSNDITNPLVFEAIFKEMIATLISNGAKGVVSNVPYITSLPHFTTVPYNPVPLDAATATLVNSSYAVYNQGIRQAFAFLVATTPMTQEIANAEIAKRTISFSAGQNAVVILDENLTDLTAINPGLRNLRQATSEDLLVLSSAAFIGTLADSNNPLSVNGVAIPLSDNWVLTPEEQLAIRTATDAYNTVIEEIANTNENIALVDFKALLQDASDGIVFDEFTLTTSLVTGGLVSLDGVHLTARGYALLANEILKSMDAKFGSNFTSATNGLAKAGDFPTNYSPMLK